MKKIFAASVLVIVAGLISSGTTRASSLLGGYFTDLAGYNQWFFDQNSEPAQLTQAQCSAAWVNQNYYLNGDVNADGVKDMGASWYFRDNFIVNGGSTPLYLINARVGGYNGTQVRYSLPQNNMLRVWNGVTSQALTAKNAWYRLSKVAPTNQWVRAVESEPLLISAPANGNPAHRTFQVAYDIRYRAFDSKAQGTSDYQVWPVANGSFMGGLFANNDKWSMKGNWGLAPQWTADYTKTANNISTSSINWNATEVAHGYECFNVTTHRCGDGVVDNGSFNNGVSANEQCDLGAQNGQPGSLCTASCQNVPVVLNPDVAIAKSVVGPINGYQSGDIITYTITYSNIGQGMANNVVITDQLPAGVVYLSSTSSPNLGAPTNIGGVLTWTKPTLAPLAGGTITVQVKITNFMACTPYLNLAAIDASNEPNTPVYTANNSANATITTSCASPNVVTSKTGTALSGTYLPGNVVEYTLAYSNIGSGVANNVVITDTLPAHVTYIPNSATSIPNIGQPSVVGNTLSWTIGTLNPGQGGTVKIRVTINANTPVCTSLQVTNNFTISASNEPPALLGDNNSIKTFIMQCVDLRSKKIVNKAIVASGEEVTYTITYGNSGNVSWPGTVIDTLPAGMQYVVGSSTSSPNVGQPTVGGNTLTWNVGILPPGSSRTITFKTIVTATQPQYLNNVCISDDNNLNNNNCGTAISYPPTPHPNFDLSINKTPKNTVAYSGDIFDYTLTVTNSGVAVNGFSVKDYLPAGLEYVSSPQTHTYTLATRTVSWNNLSIAANGTLVLTLKVKYIGPGTQTNRTEICNYNGASSATTPKDVDSNPCNGTGNNEDDVSSGTVTTPFMDVNLNKLVNGAKEANVFSGDIVDFSLVVGNSGSVTLNNFTVKDYLPAGFIFVQASDNGLYSGAVSQIIWTGLDLVAGGSKTLTFKAIYIDTVSRTNYAEVCAYNGQTVNQSGNPTSASNPKDIDSDPCNRGANPPLEDDESSALVKPRTDANIFDLEIDKLIDGVKVKDGATSGSQSTVSLVITNSGGASVSNFSVKDYMPVGLEFVPGTVTISTGTTTTSYDTGTRVLMFSGLNIPAGGSITITFKAIYAAATYITNYTEICDYRGTIATGNAAKDIDSNPCNRGPNPKVEDDESSAMIGPGSCCGGGGPTVDVTLNKLVNGVKEYSANAGETVTFTLKATNEGNTTITNVSLVDYLPQNVEYVSGTASPVGNGITFAYDATNRRLVWSGYTLLQGGIKDFSFQAVYNGSDLKTNYAEVCAYNGPTIKSGVPGQPSDLDSEPCNRGAATPVEDDESSAAIKPKGCVNCGGGSRNYCGDGLIARPNSYGLWEECDEGQNNGKPGYNCSTTCKRTDSPTCGDKILQYGEICDQGTTGGRIPAGRPYAGRMCTSNCTIPGVFNPACDYIDPPSIQSNEYLPYRWDLEDVEGLGNTCTKAGDVIRESLMCEFEVIDSKGNKVANSLGQFTWTAPCHDQTVEPLVKSAYNQVISALGYDPNNPGIRPWGYAGMKFNFTYLGEHKINMKLASYKMCVTNQNGGFTQQDVLFAQMSKKRVCSMNFAVTKPYMVSRGPLGSFASDPLTSFLYMPSGLQIFTTPLSQITQKFDAGSDVQASVQKLITQYEKLAVSDNTYTNSQKAFGTISKVPGKDIYFFKAATPNGTITINDSNADALGNKPFTIIVTQGHLVVGGNMAKAKRGMYIVTNGELRFKLDECNDTQDVHGIFIGLQGVKSIGPNGYDQAIVNNNLQAEKWCMGGDLTIRGVLIGNGVTNMTTKRRSNVNTWFTELTNINADRKEYLLNHGAVVLKYNPDIFDNLPPGADVLSQVLNTFKK